MWDISVGNQLAGVFGLKPALTVTQAYPYLDGLGDIHSIAKFEEAADYTQKHSMLDWEPETLDRYSTGTVAVASGVVTLTGGSFPSYGTNAVYSRRFYLGSNIYAVATLNSATQLTLVDTSVNASSGTSYKFGGWDYREVDPFYAANTAEWKTAQDELAVALSQIDMRASANGARVGIYEQPAPMWRRVTTINDDYATWVANVTETSSYVTTSGFTLVDWIKSHGGKLWWSNYVPVDNLASTGAKNRWLTRNQRIMETYASLGIPNAPLFRRLAVDLVTEIPDDFQIQMLDAVHAFQPFQFAWWGQAGEYDAGYAAFIEDYNRGLGWGASLANPCQSPLSSPIISPLAITGA